MMQASKRMRYAVVVLALAALAAIPAALSSPGGLDRRGGHHCRTNCSRYGLYAGQYHCHRAPCGASDIRAHRRHGH